MKLISMGKGIEITLAACLAALTGLVALGQDQDPITRLRDAAAGKDLGAQVELGLRYLRGAGVERDISEGVDWIVAAASARDLRARTLLARLYETGLVMPYEPATAFRMLLEAAVENHVAAEYGVATCYDRGRGVERDPQKARIWFERAVETAEESPDDIDAESAAAVGFCYLDGQGAEQSYPRAARWFLRAAKHDDPDALYELAILYAAGLGVSPDAGKAVALYRKAAEAGSARAYLALAVRARNGLAGEGEPDDPTPWIEQAWDRLEDEATLGSVVAATDLFALIGDGTVTGKQDSVAMDNLKRAVTQGYPRAVRLLGWEFAQGVLVEQNVARAAALLQQAAEQHDSDACHLLYPFYLRGYGVEKDPRRAIDMLVRAADLGNYSAMQKLGDWYRVHPSEPDASEQSDAWYRRSLEGYQRHAERGSPEAQMALVVLYGRGRGTEKDAEQSLYWLRRAASNEQASAAFMLGNAYEKGIGMERDPDQALGWYRRAAQNRFVPALLTLGAIYEQGLLGVEKDEVAAETWYRKAFDLSAQAAERGNADAQHLLATLYGQGVGTTKDPDASLKWMHRAADAGHDVAQLELGGMYSRGDGVERDMDRAIRYIRSAAEQGHPEAQFLLGSLYDRGEFLKRDDVEAYKWWSLAADQNFGPAGQLLEELQVTMDADDMAEGRRRADTFQSRRAEQPDVNAIGFTTTM